MQKKDIKERLINPDLLINMEKAFTVNNNCRFSKNFLKLLISRNLDTPTKVRKFLKPKITDLQNPFIIHDMYKAVIRVKKAIANNEKILIYGDKDVDGQSSISLLKKALKEYGLDAEYHIPYEEGYGVHKSIYNTLLEKNINLMITVDCGVGNKEEIDYLIEKGISVIILDHHEVVGDIPIAEAVVDPKINCSFYEENEEAKSLKYLAGCGVVFYFIWALKISYSQYFDKKFIIFDLETTGLDPENDKILEIGAVFMKNGVIEKNKCFQTFINPEIEISEYITKINGISNKTVKNAPKIEKGIEKFCDFLDKIQPDCFIIHNAPFDMNFLKNLRIKKLNKFFDFNDENFIENNEIQIIDTLKLTKNLYPKESHKLENLAKKFRLNTKFHRALNDAEITAKIYWNILLKCDFAISDYFKRFLSLSSLGTISDIMPLLNENRFLVKYGISRMKKNSIKSLKILMNDLAGDNEFLTAKYIAWNITPFLNSAGRMGKPHLGVEYLCSNNEKEILDLRAELLDLNLNRKNMQIRDEKSAEKIIKSNLKNLKKFIFVYSPDFEKNITGIVAANLVKKYNKVSFVASKNKDFTTGSVRAPKGYNVVNILEKTACFLERFGGHKLAGGYTLKTENIEKFEKKLEEIFNSGVFVDNTYSDIEVDLVLKFEDLTENFFKEILLLEPFGEANPNPLFLIEKLKIIDFNFIGTKKEHFKGKLALKDANTIDIIGWNMRKKIFVDELKNKNFNFNVLANIERDFYDGKERIRLNMQDIFLN
ncbi:MAG: single-stranded-DNA-specific exonuclease RecJ [Elusimicrobiota bacterium]|jgi:single-stranded-DNA-specific exonuclease|nr:single-stranded-DNA-specific exonuclease RecJ [Elusimicrobiota bacterium]